MLLPMPVISEVRNTAIVYTNLNYINISNIQNVNWPQYMNRIYLAMRIGCLGREHLAQINEFGKLVHDRCIKQVLLDQ